MELEVWSREEVKFVVVVPFVPEVKIGLLFAPELWEVYLVACVITLKSAVEIAIIIRQS